MNEKKKYQMTLEDATVYRKGPRCFVCGVQFP